MEFLTKLSTEQLLAVGGSSITILGWFFRLEAKVKYLEQDHKEHKAKMESKVDSIEKGISEILVAVGRLEGRNQRVDG